MAILDAKVTPEGGNWDSDNANLLISGPVNITIPTQPMKSDPATGGYLVKRSEHPTGLIVINENNKPPTPEATLPMIVTNDPEIILPLNGWPQGPHGGGVVFI
jgi:hypothetical protein